MGELMINCPKTGKPVSTGIYIGREKLGAMPVFFSSLFCPSCGSSHEWFARDAWVCDSDSGICDRRPPSAEGSLARDIATLKGEFPPQFRWTMWCPRNEASLWTGTEFACGVSEFQPAKLAGGKVKENCVHKISEE